MGKNDLTLVIIKNYNFVPTHGRCKSYRYSYGKMKGTPLFLFVVKASMCMYIKKSNEIFFISENLFRIRNIIDFNYILRINFSRLFIYQCILKIRKCLMKEYLIKYVTEFQLIVNKLQNECTDIQENLEELNLARFIYKIVIITQ